MAISIDPLVACFVPAKRLMHFIAFAPELRATYFPSLQWEVG